MKIDKPHTQIQTIIHLAICFIFTSASAMLLAATPDDNSRLNTFFESVYQQHLERNPEEQTDIGLKVNYDQWNDISDAFDDESLAIAKKHLAHLKSNFDVKHLNQQSRISYRLFEKMIADTIEDHRWRHHHYPVNQMFGKHTGIVSFLINKHKIDSVADAQSYIKRLHGTNALIKQLIENISIREKMGVLPPKFVFPHVLGDINNILAGAPFDSNKPDSPLLADFRKKIQHLKLEEKQTLQLIQQAEQALIKSLKPAYRLLQTQLEKQHRIASTDDGVWKLPNGVEFYAYRLKKITSTQLTPEEIHQYGLSEIKRIHAEMQEIMKKVAFKGSLQDFFTFVRTDKRFYYANTDAGKQSYLNQSTKLINTMRARLDEVFITKPKADMVVKAVEPFREKSAGWAFYMPAALDNSRPGTFYVNLYRMSDNPRFMEEALAYHEGIPGHHMQIAIAQELKNVPKFRTQMMYSTAFSEGWGLYSEYLPKEMGGFYTDPYSDFGRLAMELWRSIRLVVDTGLHYKKWTREQTIEFHQQNSPAPIEQKIRATERYIVMPGQATAYKIGMRKILELRELAKSSLGKQFNLGEYHNVVLTHGPLPLSMLEENIHQWIASKKPLN